MQHCNLSQDARSSRRQAYADRAAILDTAFPAHKPGALQFVHQADGCVVFHLKPLAKLPDGHPGRTPERLQGEQRLVLFRRQSGFGRQGMLAEAKELPHRVSEIGQGLIILGQQLRIHVSTITGLQFCRLDKRSTLESSENKLSTVDMSGTSAAIFSRTMKTNLKSRRAGFTLVEIMIVVAIIALLAAIAVPGFLRARKRSQASRIINDLRLIDSAVDQYAIETNKKTGDAVAVTDWTNYLKKDTVLYATGNDILGNPYGAQTVDSLPKVNQTSKNALSDVTDTAFWSPYN